MPNAVRPEGAFTGASPAGRVASFAPGSAGAMRASFADAMGLHTEKGLANAHGGDNGPARGAAVKTGDRLAPAPGPQATRRATNPTDPRIVGVIAPGARGANAEIIGRPEIRVVTSESDPGAERPAAGSDSDVLSVEDAAAAPSMAWNAIAVPVKRDDPIPDVSKGRVDAESFAENAVMAEPSAEIGKDPVRSVMQDPARPDRAVAPVALGGVEPTFTAMDSSGKMPSGGAVDQPGTRGQTRGHPTGDTAPVNRAIIRSIDPIAPEKTLSAGDSLSPPSVGQAATRIRKSAPPLLQEASAPVPPNAPIASGGDPGSDRKPDIRLARPAGQAEGAIRSAPHGGTRADAIGHNQADRAEFATGARNESAREVDRTTLQPGAVAGRADHAWPASPDRRHAKGFVTQQTRPGDGTKSVSTGKLAAESELDVPRALTTELRSRQQNERAGLVAPRSAVAVPAEGGSRLAQKDSVETKPSARVIASVSGDGGDAPELPRPASDPLGQAKARAENDRASARATDAKDMMRANPARGKLSALVPAGAVFDHGAARLPERLPAPPGEMRPEHASSPEPARAESQATNRMSVSGAIAIGSLSGPQPDMASPEFHVQATAPPAGPEGPRSASPPAPPGPPPQPVLNQMAVALHQAPNNSVDLSLRPEELGRLRMTLSPGESGITVTITAFRPETADLFRRHADTLAQEFKDLGYRDVRFNFDGSGQHGKSAPQAPPDLPDPATLASAAQAPQSPPPAVMPTDRLDIRL